ncbi:sigma-70 family RNA polymerase sigma factor [Actinomadura sp. J1-007]|nr:sigma-70 family RNA polymerase sigma factor [Actinomadura sp. J1-007]
MSRVRDAARDEELDRAVLAAQAGDEESFRALFRDVQPRLLRYAKALVGDEAEDVTSEAWLQIARDLGSFTGDIDGFRGWCATIVRHRALDQIRRRSRRPVADVPADELVGIAAEGDTAALALDGLATEAAVALIAELPPDQAEAVLLRVVVGLDAKGAGRVLGKRPGAVRTAAYRGLRRLTERLSAPPAGQHPVPLPAPHGDGGEASGAEGVR